MRRIVPPVLALLSVLAGASLVGAEETRVTVLHTTDVHGSLLPWDDLLERPVSRGLAKAATLVANVRAEGEPVLLLDNGDALAGSPLARVWHKDPAGSPEPVTLAMNAMQYDAMCLGNHEFDHGPEGLAGARAAASFPFLAANVVHADGSPAFPSSLVREFPSGVRVGVMGLCTPAVPLLTDPAMFAGYTFLAPIEVARREVARLRGAERCDAVIVLAHTGLEKDPRTGELRQGDAPGENFGWQLAHEVRGIDVIVLGHTHTVVPFAYVDEGGALLTQAGKAAEHLGRVDLTFTRATPASAWALSGRRANVLALVDTVATDSALAALLAPYAERTQAALDQVVATASARLDAPSGRFADNALWQLVHKAQLAATGADVSLAALFDPAQSIEPGPVRVRDLLRLYPYDNSLLAVELSGAELRAALEQSARYLAPYTFEDGRSLAAPRWPAYNFDMAMGVRYEVDLTRPPGQRVVELTRDGRAIADGEKLKVAVNGYRAAGGGDFVMIRRAPRIAASGLAAPDAVLEYVRAIKQLDGAVEPSWTLVPDYAATPQRDAIDRLVRLGTLPRSEVARLRPYAPLTRSEMVADVARAFGRKAATARDAGTAVTVREAMAACEAAARTARYALTAKSPDRAFRRGLATGAGLPEQAADGAGADAALRRGQWLAMLANLRYPQLRLLETTDFHGAILPGAKERRSGRPIGGTPALAAAIEHLRRENPEGTVLLDGGDIFQGTMISNLQFGRPVVEQMGLLRYAAAAIGNHDFDWTADTLKARVMGMPFAALGANIVERRSGRRPWWVRSDTTFARRGVSVSVFGLGYPGTPRVTLPANVAHLRFEDDSATAAAIVPRLRKAGADVVIEVGHIPAETDSTRQAHGDILRLARGVPGVDAWLGGHSHNVVDDVVNGSLVMIGGANGQWLAVGDLTVDPVRGKVAETRHRVVQVFGDEHPIDSAWVARVNRWNASVEPIAATVIGRNAVALHRRRPEATIGNFITDAMRLATGADIAMQNPGGMRAELPAGDVTRGRIYEVMPFDNTIVMVTLTGAEVKQSIEQALRNDRVTQVSGIRYAFDPRRPPMGRVTALTLADGSPIDEAKTYRVAVNNFMATGGDNYDALSRGAGRDETGLLIRGALEAYVRDKCKAGGALDIQEDGRIRQAGS